MIVPLIRGRASVSSAAASISATRSSVVASASARTCVPRPAGALGVEDGVRLVGLDLGRLAQADAQRPQPLDRPTLPRGQMRLDVLRRPAAVGCRGIADARVERGEDVPLGGARGAEPSIRPVRRRGVHVSLVHGAMVPGSDLDPAQPALPQPANPSWRLDAPSCRAAEKPGCAVTRGWRRSPGRRHPNRRRACRSA